MTQRSTRTPPAIVLLALVLLGAAVAGAEPRAPRTFTLVAATSEISVDGVLDEPAWAAATRIPLEFEWSPGDNVAPPEATECLVTFDHSALYVAFRAHDRQPGGIRAYLADRDTAFLDDTVGFIVDPFNDARRAFQFRINALGVQMDAVNSDVDGSEDWSWDAIWASSGRVTEDGYIVEVAVPFSSLRFPRTPGVQTWGFVATRDLPRSTRHRMRSAYTDRDRACLVCQFDKITGFAEITPGRNLEIAPTLTTLRTDARDALESPLRTGDVDPDAGLTVRWGIRPNVTANAAVNPDFSQVEADVAQLDVNTRFALFYPEKRPFFLEGADLFGTPLDVVFTRTIADPQWGAKITGKEGPHAFGIVAARDEVATLLFPANQESSVDGLAAELSNVIARYRRDVGETSTIGALVTSREGGGYHNRVAGIDGSVRFTQTDTVRFQLVASSTAYPVEIARRQAQPEGSFNGLAYRGRYFHAGRNWFWHIAREAIDSGFRADNGFMPRVDAYLTEGGASYTFLGDSTRWFNRIEAGVGFDRVTDGSGRLTDFGLDFPVAYQGPRQTVITYNPAPNREFFAGRTYDNFRHNFSFETRPTGAIAVGLDGGAGETIDFTNARAARQVRLGPYAEFKAGRHVSGTLSHSFQRLEVDEGRLFTANLTELRALWFFNQRTFVRSILQYTDVDRNAGIYLSPVPARTRRLFSQWLFSYKLNPQTLVLLGYSDNFQGERGVDLTQTSRTFFVKLGYAWVL